MSIRINPNFTNYNYPQGREHFGDSCSVPNCCNNSNKDKNLKTKVFFTTAAGILTALAIIAKKQGFTLNPKKIFSQNPKEWAIFKYKTTSKGKPLKMEEKQIIPLAVASVLGGLVGGIAFDDKKHAKAKLKESVSQLFGAVLIPLLFVAGTSRVYNKYKPKIESIMPAFKNPANKKLLKGVNALSKGLPAIAITFASLGTGIVVGNKVSNFINEKVFHKKVNRNIRATDFAPHLDDLCLASSLMAAGNTFGNIVARFIPLALMVAGNEVGKAKENED